MIKFLQRSLLAIFIGVCFGTFAQPAHVTKTNPMKVYMHYMPWFDAPPFSTTWGWHWTMNNKNPASIDTEGKRQIASHFYPLIGPYATKDPDVIEYHLLLMKLSGIDGVLIDWYGNQGSNSDVQSLLTNSNEVINRTDDVGLEFSLIIEDRFWNLTQAKSSFTYAKNNYFNKANYTRHGADNDPLVGVFGPITFSLHQDANSPAKWTEILAEAGEPIEFLTLWGESADAGVNADGEYIWIWENENPDNGPLVDYYSHLQNYYNNQAGGLKTVMAIAYPGFQDFYAEGGAGAGYFTIEHNDGEVLNKTLGLVDQHQSKLDFLQLGTWNDFGEGTMFEPTLEFGFSFLTRIQEWTGVPYTEEDLKSVYKLYSLRKKYANVTAKQTQLNSVFDHFVALEIDEAVALMTQIENASGTPGVKTFPGRLEAEFYNSIVDAQIEPAIDAGGGFAVSWIDAGDSLVFSINPDSAMTYPTKFRITSMEGAEFELINNNQEVLSTIVVPAAGELQKWSTVNADIILETGEQNLVIKGKSGQFSINYLEFAGPAVVNGVSEYEAHVQYWPTEVTGTLNIKTDGSYESLHVVDMIGRPYLMNIDIKHLLSISVDVADIPSGLYIVQLKGKHIKAFKILKR